MLDTDAIKRRMEELGLSQAEVAHACGMTQPHLSKILSKRVGAGRRATASLLAWAKGEHNISADEQLHRLAQRLEVATPKRRMLAMQFLASLERLL